MASGVGVSLVADVVKGRVKCRGCMFLHFLVCFDQDGWRLKVCKPPVVVKLFVDLNTGTRLRDAFKQSGPSGRRTHAMLTRPVRLAHTVHLLGRSQTCPLRYQYGH